MRHFTIILRHCHLPPHSSTTASPPQILITIKYITITIKCSFTICLPLHYIHLILLYRHMYLNNNFYQTIAFTIKVFFILVNHTNRTHLINDNHHIHQHNQKSLPSQSHDLHTIHENEKFIKI